MAQHHLHSKEARNFARTVKGITNEQAEAMMAKIRWGSESSQACPHCCSFRPHYRRHHRTRWRCAACAREFSVTTGTALHGHKLPLSDIVHMACQFASGANGLSILSLTRHTGMTPKSAQTNLGKVREALVNSTDLTPMKGVVHVDGI